MNTDPRIARGLSGLQRTALTLARIAVGWHFLYEGVVKLMDAQWSAAPYLASATGPLAGFFRALAANDAALKIVDPMNAWGLALVGVALMAGALTRPASLGGIALLALYYAARPSLIGAPPDPFSASGQVWNLPPLSPIALNRQAMEPMRRVISANMRHAAALRADRMRR